MTTANKKMKLIDSQSRNTNNNYCMDVGEDRISQLPESLMLHILSFLPTKRAVSTTVLSSRWNNFWVSLPVLDFREWQTNSYGLGVDLYFKELYKETKRFMDFLDMALLSNDGSTIQKFCLNCSNTYFNENRVREWISALISRKVEELILIADRPNPKLLPLELFTCESLTMLDIKFQMEDVLDFPQSISLPSLKVLRISRVEFKDMASTERLFSNCPILEELILCQCKCSGKDVISFSAPHLKYFVLKSYPNLKFQIDAPNLLSIKFGGMLPRDFPVGDFPSLAEADFLDSSGDKTTTLDSLSKLVTMCCNIKHLKASYDYLQMFSIANVPNTSFPTFANLMHLEVPCNDHHFHQPWISSLFNFLHFTPNLESIAVDQVHHTQNLNGCEMTVNTTPLCLSVHLNSIEFRNFNGSPKEFELVKLFLKHARVLEVVIIRSGYSSAKMIRKLQTVPRASTHCSFQATRHD